MIKIIRCLKRSLGGAEKKATRRWRTDMEGGLKAPRQDGDDVSEDAGQRQLLESLCKGEDVGGVRRATEDRKIRRRSATYPLDNREKKYSRRFSFEKSWTVTWRQYVIGVLLFYAICVLVVITIFNAVFLSKLKYLACTIAKTWSFSFPMC